MRRTRILLGAGVGLTLLSLPLWSITRTADCMFRVNEHHPADVCDPRLYLPFGDLALVVTGLGLLAVLAAGGFVLVRMVRRVRASESGSRG